MNNQPTPADVLRSLASRRGGLSALAKDLKLTGQRPLGTVWAWIDRNHVPPEHAAQIELLESGNVTVEQLTRGVRWRRVPDPKWPNAAGRPLIDVTGPDAPKVAA